MIIGQNKNKVVVLKFVTLGLIGFLLIASLPGNANSYSYEYNNDMTQYETDFSKSGTITFGQKNHISLLPFHKISSNAEKYISSDFEKIMKDFNFKDSEFNLFEMKNDSSYLQINGLKPCSIPGNPMLPIKTFKIELPKNSEIIDISISDGYYKEILQNINIIAYPQPIEWVQNNIDPQKYLENFIKNVEIYNKNKLFPGDLISYIQGENNHNKQIFIKLYPVQYNPQQKKIYVLTEGTIQLIYKKPFNTSSKTPILTNFENVIITHSSFYNQAIELKKHHDLEGTSTLVINTSWINDNYEMSDDPPYYGYSNQSLNKDRRIQDYDYNLSKKIISYLQNTSSFSNLKYVTLFGNARLVPPSYYCSFTHGWVPTDFFYSSPDFDLIPNYMIGRLPVNDTIQASQIVEKIKNWKPSSDEFGKIAVAGGKPFGTPFDIGEMIVVDSINRGYFEGVNPTKYFRTENTFNKENMIDALTGDYGLLYHIGHGNGEAIGLEGDPLYAEDLLNLEEFDMHPIVISIACGNGAFDTNVYNSSFQTSFGESILLSKAGGISYIGGSRSNLGVPLFTLENGCVNIIHEPYMAGMLTNVIKEYHTSDSDSKLGDLTTQAMLSYIQENDFSDMNNNFTFFEFVLLGDPALKLPGKSNKDEYSKPTAYIENILDYLDSNTIRSILGIIAGGEIPLRVKMETINFVSTTSSPNVEIKIINALEYENMVYEKRTENVVDETVIFDFTPEKGSFYVFRVITDDGKETWQYCIAPSLVDDDYTKQTSGWEVNRWSNIHEAIETLSSFEFVYVHSGEYTENHAITLKKPVYVLGENVQNTILKGNHDDHVIKIESSSCLFSGFTILGSKSESAGLYIDGYYFSIDGNKFVDCNTGIYLRNIEFPIIFENEFNNCKTGILLENSSYFIVFDNTINESEIAVKILDSYNGMLLLNDINTNSKGVYFLNSEGNSIYFNNFTKNDLGLLIEKSQGNMIMMNNFIENNDHATFLKSKSTLWLNNYWDNWIGLYLKNYNIPKLLVGRLDSYGIIPWINIDALPLDIPLILDFDIF